MSVFPVYSTTKASKSGVFEGDERIYHEGFADLDLAMIPVENRQLSVFY